VTPQAVVHGYAAASGYGTALIVFVVIIGLVVGVIVAVDVRRKRSADPTDEPAQAGPWYRQLLARFRSRARFVLTLDAEDAGRDGEVVTDSTTAKIWLRVYVGVTNASQADAGQTTIKVLVPRGCDAQWVGAETTVESEPTTELLDVGQSQVQASCLTKVLPQVGPRDNRVDTLAMTVHVPPRGQGAARIPIRLRASSNELGVGEDPVIDRIFSVRRG
jgi:hypothetical protein